MRKILLGTKMNSSLTDSEIKLSANECDCQLRKKLDHEYLQKMMRMSRSQGYLSGLSKLDAGSEADMGATVELIKEKIQAEFPTVDYISNMLIGIIAPCYLGDNYEVHIVDLQKNIIKHYVRGQSLPNGLEVARRIAMKRQYDYVEVYEHQFCLISEDGSVSVVER